VGGGPARRKSERRLGCVCRGAHEQLFIIYAGATTIVRAISITRSFSNSDSSGSVASRVAPALLKTDSAVRYWFSVLKNSCMKSVPSVVSRSMSCIAGLTVFVHDEMTT
jgi:hypothetical protein